MGLGATNGALTGKGPGSKRAGAPSGILRVVIADDHPFYRQGLARLLSQSGVEVVGEAANGPDAIELVERTAPDVAVVDLNMPGMSGVEVTRRLNERMPASRVLVVSVSAQEDDVTEAILAGASGYVLKDGPVEQEIGESLRIGASAVAKHVSSVLMKLHVENRVEAAMRSVRPHAE